MKTTVGVCIPSIPPRKEMLSRALSSVLKNTLLPNQVSVAIDHEGEGAAVTRNKALVGITTEWVAFLDDDDEFLPQHLEKCLNFALQHEADFVYPWFEGINQGVFRVRNEQGNLVDPLDVLWHEGMEPYLRSAGNFIPVTVLVKTEMIKRVGGFHGSGGDGAQGEDYDAWIKLLDEGAKFVHLPERTWRWNGHPEHTAGRIWTDLSFYHR